jgi:hypothetical protein
VAHQRPDLILNVPGLVHQMIISKPLLANSYGRTTTGLTKSAATPSITTRRIAPS